MAFDLYNGRAAWDRAGILITNVDDSGLSDSWEIQWFGHLGVDPNAVQFTDGLSNYQKAVLKLDPTHAAIPDTNGVINLQVYTPLK